MFATSYVGGSLDDRELRPLVLLTLAIHETCASVSLVLRLTLVVSIHLQTPVQAHRDALREVLEQQTRERFAWSLGGSRRRAFASSA